MIETQEKDSAVSIPHLLSTYRSEQNELYFTVLETIGRTYDECFISRLLLYALRKDTSLVNGIFSECIGREISARITTAECEKCIPSGHLGRIDLFIEAEGDDGQRYTLTIENKVNSYEHDDQTETYYKYVTRNYRTYHNLFLFLAPTYNHSSCSCAHFKKMSYRQIHDLISTNDNVTREFQKHIRKFFSGEEQQMNKTDLEVLQNYDELKKIISHAQTTFENFQTHIFNALKCEIGSEVDVWRTQIKGGSYRYYKNFWWNDSKKDKKFYFYAELYYTNNSPREIYVQSTIKKYSKTSVIDKFIEHNNIAGRWSNSWFVHYSQKFISDKPIFSYEWQNELERFAREEIKIAVKKTDDLFRQFEASDFSTN